MFALLTVVGRGTGQDMVQGRGCRQFTFRLCVYVVSFLLEIGGQPLGVISVSLVQVPVSDKTDLIPNNPCLRSFKNLN